MGKIRGWSRKQTMREMSFFLFPHTDLQSNSSPPPVLVPTSLHVVLNPTLSLWVGWQVTHEVGLVQSKFFFCWSMPPTAPHPSWPAVPPGSSSAKRSITQVCVSSPAPSPVQFPQILEVTAVKCCCPLYCPNLFFSWYMKHFLQIKLCLFFLEPLQIVHTGSERFFPHYWWSSSFF